MFDFHTNTKPHPVIFAAAFDPEGFKQASLDMVREAGVNLRLHSWFQSTIIEDGRAAGVVVETKEGSQAIRGSVVIDATGDLDVAASANTAFLDGSYIVTHRCPASAASTPTRRSGSSTRSRNASPSSTGRRSVSSTEAGNTGG